ncbi:large ribosomal subunit protein cL37 alpha [Cornus florida]|uniref:large ribosomal subunit protein cL37 alpha n=1 Tax=Cornus florida TaxID=4283 RepID=UPI002898BB6A|nr:large ribosomal subunit protein cL37 alpha [Cornus florida]
MALLLASTPTPSFASPSSSSSSPSTTAITVNPFSRLHKASIVVCPKSFNGLQIYAPFVLKERVAVIVKAASVDGMGSDGGEPPSEGKEEVVPVENLPLESKLQLKLEQKTRMKLAKKIRLRRKRLVRKRHLRKKGRWPPSKMNKNKNV